MALFYLSGLAFLLASSCKPGVQPTGVGTALPLPRIDASDLAESVQEVDQSFVQFLNQYLTDSTPPALANLNSGSSVAASSSTTGNPMIQTLPEYSKLTTHHSEPVIQDSPYLWRNKEFIPPAKKRRTHFLPPLDLSTTPSSSMPIPHDNASSQNKRITNSRFPPPSPGEVVEILKSIRNGGNPDSTPSAFGQHQNHLSNEKQLDHHFKLEPSSQMSQHFAREPLDPSVIRLVEDCLIVLAENSNHSWHMIAQTLDATEFPTYLLYLDLLERGRIPVLRIRPLLFWSIFDQIRMIHQFSRFPIHDRFEAMYSPSHLLWVNLAARFPGRGLAETRIQMLNLMLVRLYRSSGFRSDLIILSQFRRYCDSVKLVPKSLHALTAFIDDSCESIVRHLPKAGSN